MSTKEQEIEAFKKEIAETLLYLEKYTTEKELRKAFHKRRGYNINNDLDKVNRKAKKIN